jgi:hypothetical protein
MLRYNIKSSRNYYIAISGAIMRNLELRKPERNAMAVGET